MKPEDLDKRDHKYVLETPDEGFSPERNKWVIENSIKKMDAMLAKRKKEWRDKTAERVDAITTFLNANVANNNPLTSYFGKRWIAYLRGETVLDKVYKKRLEADPNKLYHNIRKSQIVSV
jgi:hypothetical protein